MRTRIVILLTLLTMGFPVGAVAGNLDELDVLADLESQAITMIQDSDGFLWIGTYVDGGLSLRRQTAQTLYPGLRSDLGK